MNAAEPQGRRPRHLTIGRIGVYAFLATAALFFLLPLWIMVVTSLKPMEEIRLGNILALPAAMTFDAWAKAWSSACTGLECNGISVGFWNSVRILIPSVIFSIIAGAINGYALSFWRVKGANVMFGILLLGAFIPYQVFLYPLVRIFSMTGIYNSLTCIVLVHVIFGLPTMTLLFRNYYAGLPLELFKAATGANLVHVPYRGGGNTLPDFVAGNVDGVLIELASVLDLHRDGRGRILGVAAPQRSPAAPDLPTFIEQGYEGFVAASFVGLFAPAGTPEEAIRRLQAAIAEAASDPGVLARLASFGADPPTGPELTTPGVAAFLQGELAKARRAIAIAGLKPE
jgi:hypothetical protein